MSSDVFRELLGRVASEHGKVEARAKALERQVLQLERQLRDRKGGEEGEGPQGGDGHWGQDEDGKHPVLGCVQAGLEVVQCGSSGDGGSGSEAAERPPKVSERAASSCGLEVDVWESRAPDETTTPRPWLSARDVMLRPHWVGVDAVDTAVSNRSRRTFATRTIHACTGLRVGDNLRAPGILGWCVVHPSSRKRIMWDLMSFVVMGLDVILLPLQVFELPQTMALAFLNWWTILFWSFDLVGSFFVGFHTGGITEMRPKATSARYLKTWFLPDFVILCIDWYMVFQVEGSGKETVGFARISRMMRFIRALRLVRLLRLVKVMSTAAEFGNLIQSDEMLTAFGVARLVSSVGAINHCIACAWYLVGRSSGSETTNWIILATSEFSEPPDIAYMYLTSLHWSLTQFTPASMEVFPENALERAFTVVVIIFSLLVFSSFVSRITSEMMSIQKMRAEEQRQHELVRRFVTERKFPLDLGNRINTFARHHMSSSKRICRLHEKDVAILSEMPEALKMEMRAQDYIPNLVCHPLFDYFERVDEEGLVFLCHSSITESCVQHGHQLFAPAQESSSMIFVISGKLMYCKESGSDIPVIHQLCELALWVPWKHCGSATATGSCEVLLLGTEAFGTAVSLSQLLPHCRCYAKALAKSMATAGPEVSDVWPDMCDVDGWAQEAFAGAVASTVGPNDAKLHSLSRLEAPPLMSKMFSMRFF